MDNKQMCVVLISNIIFEPYIGINSKRFRDLNVNFTYVPYLEYQSKDYSEKIAQSNVIIVWLNLEAVCSDVWNHIFKESIKSSEIMDALYFRCTYLKNNLSKLSKAKIVWFLFEDYYTHFSKIMGNVPLCNNLVDRLNILLCDNITDNITFIDLKHIIANIGIENAYNFKSRYRWNAPYSDTLYEAAFQEVYKQCLIEKGETKKCLVLDCDNVLWGGILQEDGIENIALSGTGLGRVYQDFQKFVLSLHYKGVILAINSKNDIKDIMLMFREHRDMVLKEEDISYFCANWDNKADNIKKIASNLNIGLDSIVFVDDSLFEINSVKAILPEITVIQFEREHIYEKLTCFNINEKLDFDVVKKRYETYHTNQYRDKLKSQYICQEDYIKALNLKIDIHISKPVEFNRISELLRRTNKCTNGKRYMVSEIEARYERNDVWLYSVYVADRFSDLGLVGVMEVEKNILTVFSLSCRALGLGVSKVMVDYIGTHHKVDQIEFYQTNKNTDIGKALNEAFLEKN